MIRYKSLLKTGLSISVLVLGLFVFSGCQAAKPQKAEPVFFPPPPEQAKLQFLKSFSGPEDVEAASPSAFETFILGQPETTDTIKSPYGMALFEGKLYVCDVGKKVVEVLDLEKHTFDYLTKDRRLMNPVNICIENDGTKYVADPIAGAVFVFDVSNTLKAILGMELKIHPADVIIRDQQCYATDLTSNQVVVMNKTTGQEISRIGKAGDEEGQFKLISDLTLDAQGNIYVSDRIKAQIFKFNKDGVFQQTIGRLGDNIDELVRPKGIAVDRENRIWVVDAATEVAKIYDAQGRLLLFFGLPGNNPGMMNLPAKVILDYDHVKLFQKYAVPGAKLDFLVLVSNQYGLHKINVYGFGGFPEQGRQQMRGQK